MFQSNIFAHVINEISIYEDIQLLKVKDEIIFLRGINVISEETGANLFRPQEKLKKVDLAYWAGNFKEVGTEGSNKNVIVKEAFAKGLVSSLEGNTTYSEVNHAYFDGKAILEQPDRELTREEFVIFMGQYLKKEINGNTLMKISGHTSGPVGIIEQVTSETVGEDKNKYNVYTFTINGLDFKLSSHVKVLYGPIDLNLWKGKKIIESWISNGKLNNNSIQIVVLESGQFSDSEMMTAPSHHNSSVNSKLGKDMPMNHIGQTINAKENIPYVLIVSCIILFVIFIWFFVQPKRRSPNARE